MDKATLAARLDDFEGARQAIVEAEKLGCSPGQVQMLLGQVALYQGQNDEAIDHLRQAVELLPESVAAWAMLAVAYNAARPTEFEQALKKATRLPAVMPEDYLFRGHAEGLLDSGRGLQSLDEAVRRRPSVLARLVRIDVLKRNILDTPDAGKARLAMEEMQWIKQALPDNPMVLSVSISVHLVCHHVFDEFRLPEQRQLALKEGMKDAHELERYHNLPSAVTARWVFLQGIGQERSALADLRHIAETTNDVNAAYYCGVAQYIYGQFEQAARVLEKHKGENVYDLVRIMCLAELGDGGPARAYHLYEEIAARDLRSWDLFNSQLILRFLGRKEKAIEVSRKFITQPDRFPPVGQDAFRRQLEYCAGQRSAEELVSSMSTRGDLSGAHVCIALTALADGHREKTREHVRLCLATRFFDFLPYDLSLMLLSRMEKDPAWPPWIPQK